MTEPGLPSAHIVDQLIEERAMGLRANRLVWPLVRTVFYPMLGYRKAVRIADGMASLSGRAAMDWCQDFLSLQVSADGIDAVPGAGACVILANHPGGIADGIAVWEALKERRPDMVFFANRDALRVCAGLDAVVIPVEWREGHRSRDKTRETLRAAIEAFRKQRCVVVFPAGKMSVWDWRIRGLREEAWMPTAMGLARKFDAPIIPLGVRQRMSWMFYALGQVSAELKHMTVFHELLAKRGAPYRLNFGAALRACELPAEDGAATDELRAMSEQLAWGRA